MFETYPNRSPSSQRGASLITAIFLITALAILGALMTRLTILGQNEVIDEWYSSQALHAAESGADWGGHYIQNTLFPACPAVDTYYHPSGAGVTTPQDVVAGSAWFTMQIRCKSLDSLYIYKLTSVGSAGGSSASPRTLRTLTLQFVPD